MNAPGNPVYLPRTGLLPPFAPKIKLASRWRCAEGDVRQRRNGRRLPFHAVGRNLHPHVERTDLEVPDPNALRKRPCTHLASQFKPSAADGISVPPSLKMRIIHVRVSNSIRETTVIFSSAAETSESAKALPPGGTSTTTCAPPYVPEGTSFIHGRVASRARRSFVRILRGQAPCASMNSTQNNDKRQLISPCTGGLSPFQTKSSELFAYARLGNQVSQVNQVKRPQLRTGTECPTL